MNTKSVFKSIFSFLFVLSMFFGTFDNQVNVAYAGGKMVCLHHQLVDDQGNVIEDSVKFVKQANVKKYHSWKNHHDEILPDSACGGASDNSDSDPSTPVSTSTTSPSVNDASSDNSQTVSTNAVDVCPNKEGKQVQSDGWFLNPDGICKNAKLFELSFDTNGGQQPTCMNAWYALKFYDDCKDIIESAGGVQNLNWSTEGLVLKTANTSLTVDQKACTASSNMLVDPANMLSVTDGTNSAYIGALLHEGDSSTISFANGYGEDITIKSQSIASPGWFDEDIITIKNPCWTPTNGQPPVIKIKVHHKRPAVQSAKVCINPVNDIVANDGDKNASITDQRTGKIWQRFTFKFDGVINHATANEPCSIITAGLAKGSTKFELYRFDYNGNMVEQLTFTSNLSEVAPVISPDFKEVAFSVMNRKGMWSVGRMDRADGKHYHFLMSGVHTPSYTSDGRISVIDSKDNNIEVLGNENWQYNPLDSQRNAVQWNLNGESMIRLSSDGNFFVFDFAHMHGQHLPVAVDYCLSPDGSQVCQIGKDSSSVAQLDGTKLINSKTIVTVEGATFAEWGYQTSTNNMQSATFEQTLAKIAFEREYAASHPDAYADDPIRNSTASTPNISVTEAAQEQSVDVQIEQDPNSITHQAKALMAGEYAWIVIPGSSAMLAIALSIVLILVRAARKQNS